jgi:metal-responsive CopG/Arc/MetJ family transcriptional regulator
MSDQIKFEVTCDPSFAKAFDSLSSRLGKTRSDTIRDALNFYENAVNEWEKGKGSAEADQKSRLIYELEEAAKEYAEAQKERAVTKKAMEEAGRKDLEIARKVGNARIVVNACSLRLQDFVFKLHSTESMQEEEQ